jgi:hypothetical protein
MSDDHPWKTNDHPYEPQRGRNVAAIRSVRRGKVKSIESARIGIRVQPRFREDMNALLEATGLTATEIIEDAVHAYRKSQSAPRLPSAPEPFALASGDDDTDWRFLDDDID